MAASRAVQQRRQDAAKHIIVPSQPSCQVLVRGLVRAFMSNDDEMMVVAGNVENYALPLRFLRRKVAGSRGTQLLPALWRILHEDDSDPEVWCVLGVTYQRLGELDVAKQYFERTLARMVDADTDPELARQRTHVQGLLSQVTAEIANGRPDAGNMEVDA